MLRIQEVQVVEAGQMEFSRLHRMLDLLERHGWRLEQVVTDELRGGLRLMLRRELRGGA